MWKTLMKEQYLVPQAYQVATSIYSEEMYFVLLMRFETFVELKLADSSDDVLAEWSAASAPPHHHHEVYQEQQAQARISPTRDLLNFTPDVASTAPAPAPEVQGAPPSGLAAMWGQLSPTPATP